MTRDDEACLKLGREVSRILSDLRKVAGDETGYARRRITFPGGAVDLFLVNDPKLGDAFEAAASAGYTVHTVVPPSARN
jgi:hypothetical protein